MRLSPNIHWREIDGQVVVLDPRRGRYLSVNTAGAALWPALLAGSDEDELTGVLVDRYGITPERAGADLSAFLRWLEQKELLER